METILDEPKGIGELEREEMRARDLALELLMKRTAICASVFAVVVLVMSIIRLNTRSVILKDTIEAQETSRVIEDVLDSAFDIQVTPGAGSLEFALPGGTDSGDIDIVNQYTSRELWMYIADGRNFYNTRTQISAPAGVTGCRCVPQSDGRTVCLRFMLDGVYEYSSSMEENHLTVTLGEPHEIYDRIVVVNTILQSDSAYECARKLAERLEADKIRVYQIRMDEMLGSDDLALFLHETKPELVINLTDGENCSLIYNDSLYLRGYGNDDFARQVVADVSYELGTDAIGVKPLSAMTDGDASGIAGIMNNISVPSVLVYVPAGVSGTADDSDTGAVTGAQGEAIETGLYKAVTYAYLDIGK